MRIMLTCVATYAGATALHPTSCAAERLPCTLCNDALSVRGARLRLFFRVQLLDGFPGEVIDVGNFPCTRLDLAPPLL